MANAIEDAVRKIAAPVADGLSYELVDVEFIKKRGAESELVIYIDKDGGVTLEDCEKLSTALDPVLDAQDPVPGSYVLCVSSPGIDRPLKTKRDFEKNMGKRVDIKLYQKMDGVKQFTATLRDITKDAVLLQVGTEKQLTLPLKQIAQIKPHIDF